MSVVTKNPFALLNDDDDEETTAGVAVPASAVETLPEEPKTQKSETRNVPNGRATKGAKTDDGFEQQVSRGDRRGRGGDRGDRGERGERGGRGRGRAGRGRGGGGGGGFDRQSHTGHVDSQKQVHQGWGGDTAEVEQSAEVEGAADAIAELTAPTEPAPQASADGAGWATDAPTGWGEATAEAAAAPVDNWAGPAPATPAVGTDPTASAQSGGRSAGPPPEEVDNTVSFEEWQKKQKQKDTGLTGLIPKLETRKVGEGQAYEEGVLNRSGQDLLKSPKAEEEAFFIGKNKTTKSPTTHRTKKEKVVIEIEPRFAPIERGGRGRGRGGDRGGDRGRGGRGRGRGEGGFRGDRFGGDRPAGNGRAAGGGANVDVDDTSAFPTLT